jgi:hypothetical protein
MARYITDNPSPHGFQEELQWARIVGSGHAPAGMAVIYTQKLCALVHEFQPAQRAGLLSADALPHFAERIVRRIDKLLRALELNGLDALDGVAGLRALRADVLAGASLAELARVSERAHDLNHQLTDALELVIGAQNEL